MTAIVYEIRSEGWYVKWYKADGCIRIDGPTKTKPSKSELFNKGADKITWEDC